MPAGSPGHYNITLLQKPPVEKRIDPRWHRKSILNRINPDQTFRNLVGRKRIDPDGRLLDWSNLTIIRSAEDALNSDLLVTTLLSPEQCRGLSTAFQELENRSGDNQPLPFADVAATKPAAGRLMLETRDLVLQRVTEFFRLKAPIRQGPLQFVRRDVGAFMQPDVGNAVHTGGRESRGGGLSGILYLNDGYDGGELYFTARNSVIKPQAGLFVAMSAGFHHEHAVLRIQQGTGLTMHSFLTFDPQN